MNTDAIAWVLDNWARWTPAMKLSMMCMAMGATGDGPWSTRVSRPEVAALAGLQVDSVNRTIANLVDGGVLKAELLPEGDRKGGWYRYTFG